MKNLDYYDIDCVGAGEGCSTVKDCSREAGKAVANWIEDVFERLAEGRENGFQ